LLSEPFSGPETYFFVSTSCKQTATLISWTVCCKPKKILTRILTYIAEEWQL
jgi:hypothetical protein